MNDASRTSSDLAYRCGGIEIDAMQRRVLLDGTPAKVGARAFDVLLALVERRDRVEPKRELMDLVWLGVTSSTRSPQLPSVATLDEQGVKGYEVSAWGGYVAPAGTPSAIVGRLNAELIRIFASPEAKQKVGSQGFDLSPPLTPAAFTNLIAEDLTRWAPVLKASGAKAD